MALQPSAKGALLPEVLDLTAAGPLAADLLGLRGAAMTLDASQVKRLGGLCLQVLLAAQAAWDADGQTFRVAARSPAFDEALALFGADAFDVDQGALS
jgi:chemotaxis protein CheX